MTAEKKNGATGFVEIAGVRYHTTSFEFEGTKYTVRELSPDEGDEATDAAKDQKGEVNPRVETKMLLAKSVVEPAIGFDQIGRLGSQTYQMILRAFNKVNIAPAEVPTPPAG